MGKDDSPYDALTFFTTSRRGVLLQLRTPAVIAGVLTFPGLTSRLWAVALSRPGTQSADRLKWRAKRRIL